MIKERVHLRNRETTVMNSPAEGFFSVCTMTEYVKLGAPPRQANLALENDKGTKSAPPGSHAPSSIL